MDERAGSPRVGSLALVRLDVAERTTRVVASNVAPWYESALAFADGAAHIVGGYWWRAGAVGAPFEHVPGLVPGLVPGHGSYGRPRVVNSVCYGLVLISHYRKPYRVSFHDGPAAD